MVLSVVNRMYMKVHVNTRPTMMSTIQVQHPPDAFNL
eukprot:CAMPEP_0198693172 /NCGR_PEP_ID=MMETSP1468-20131203/244848_1 /TAXON_ID=1461545 /ORGANISM="Mantoniella sp, Strain CCMP1436" /LENGTH=36 /DNA_ID= /DNA_START= /DNA_END= /DNA_ORIENTATION=